MMRGARRGVAGAGLAESIGQVIFARRTPGAIVLLG